MNTTHGRSGGRHTKFLHLKDLWCVAALAMACTGQIDPSSTPDAGDIDGGSPDVVQRDGQTDIDTGLPPIDPDCETLSFAEVEPILERCTGCHRGTSPPRGVTLTSYAGALDVVTPGDCASSLMFQMIDSGRMPNGGARLPQEFIDRICRWIDDGALETSECSGTCGDGTCDLSESCDSCAEDCGSCPVCDTLQWSDVAPIFSQCTVCHGTERSQKGLRFDSYNDFADEDGDLVIEPGDCRSSKVFEELDDGDMPRLLNADGSISRESRRLPQEEIDRICAWIEQGAVENANCVVPD